MALRQLQKLGKFLTAAALHIHTWLHRCLPEALIEVNLAAEQTSLTQLCFSMPKLILQLMLRHADTIKGYIFKLVTFAMP